MGDCVKRYREEQERRATSLYFAECARILTENTAKCAHGSYMTVKLADILNPKPQDDRSAEEIIASIKSKLKSMEGQGAQE